MPISIKHVLKHVAVRSSPEEKCLSLMHSSPGGSRSIRWHKNLSVKFNICEIQLIWFAYPGGNLSSKSGFLAYVWSLILNPVLSYRLKLYWKLLMACLHAAVQCNLREVTTECLWPVTVHPCYYDAVHQLTKNSAELVNLAQHWSWGIATGFTELKGLITSSSPLVFAQVFTLHLASSSLWLRIQHYGTSL